MDKDKILLNLVKFFIFFNLLSIPMYYLIYTNLSLPFLQSSIAILTNQIFNLIGIKSEIENFTLIVEKINFTISTDSTGWKSIYILTALALATPSIEISRKVKFLVIGVPAIFLINILRILTTIWITVRLGFEYFDIVHTFLWREGLILAVLMVWIFWVTKSKNIGLKSQ